LSQIESSFKKEFDFKENQSNRSHCKYVLDSSSVDSAALAEARPNPLPDFGSQSQLEDECSKSQNLQNQKVEVVIEELMH
jgi:hypothetical protein